MTISETGMCGIHMMTNLLTMVFICWEDICRGLSQEYLKMLWFWEIAKLTKTHYNSVFIIYYTKSKAYILKTLLFINPQIILTIKYPISTPLMMENPVKSPMVPPIADSFSCHFAALSLVMMSNVGVSNSTLIYLKFLFFLLNSFSNS